MKGHPNPMTRPFKDGDIEPVAELMRQTWISDVDREVGRLASLAILASYLSEHEWGLVAEEEGHVVGTILAGLKHTDQSARWSSLARSAMDQAGRIDPAFPEMLRAEGSVEAEEARVTHLLKASERPEADATIQLLILAPEARGKHLGSHLFASAHDWMRSRGARGYFLMTDDECDVGFYDHAGLRTLSTTSVSRDGQTINVYAYGELL